MSEQAIRPPAVLVSTELRWTAALAALEELVRRDGPTEFCHHDPYRLREIANIAEQRITHGFIKDPKKTERPPWVDKGPFQRKETVNG